MRKISFSSLLLIGVVCVLACHSCNTCSRRQVTTEVGIDLDDWGADSMYADMARKALYALPTPIEMSMLIKNSGIPWRPALLNDPANASKYLSSHKMALNFGVYVTNLTYAGLFEQSQTALRYKLAISQLIEALGLQSAINTNTLQQLEQNIDDKEMVLRIVAETYFLCTGFLSESDRYSLVLAILTGGWVESMYIATSTLDEKLLVNENSIKQLVIDLILSFDMLWKVMSDLKEIPAIEELADNLSGLAQLFDRILLHQTQNDVSIGDFALADNDISEISSENIIKVTPKDYENIKIQIQLLRDNFTKI